MLRNPLLRQFNWSRLLLCLILIVAFIVYSNTLHQGFVWDDFSYIIDWHQIKNFSLSNFLAGDQPGFNSGVYRPIRNLIFPLAFQYCGFSPSCYHLQAVIFHLIIVYLVYLISTKLLTTNYSLLTVLLFALHPIHVEAVTWITASFDLVGIIFVLTSFYLYLISLELKRFPSTAYRLSLLAAFLAFMSNETTLILPLLILFYKLIYSPALKGRPLKQYQSDTVKKSDFKQTNISIIHYFLLATSYLPIRLIFMGNLWRHLTLSFNLLQRFLLVIYVYFEYLVTLVWPTHLSINHYLTPSTPSFYYLDLGLRPINIPLNLNTFIISSIIVSLIIIAFLIRRRLPLFTFGISWLFISLLPVSQLFPQAILFSERYVYFASIGFCFSLASVIITLNRHLPQLHRTIASSSIIVIFTFLLSAFYFHITFTYNSVWKNDFSLWKYDLQQHPNSASALNGVGSGYLQSDNYKQALPYFQQAAAINPAILIYQTNYINTLEKVGDTNTLISTLEQFLQHHPNSPEALSRLVRAYTTIGDTQKIKLYQQQLNQLNQPSSAP